jgi:hypothetical protein
MSTSAKLWMVLLSAVTAAEAIRTFLEGLNRSFV